jgi:hypothetical protein
LRLALIRLPQPHNAAALLPLALPLGVLASAEENAHAMHLVFLPGANIFVSVCEYHRAVAILLSILETPIILGTHLMNQLAHAVKLSLNKRALIHFIQLCPSENPLPWNLAIHEIAPINGAIWLCKFAQALALSFLKMAFVKDSIRHSLSSKAMLTATLPVSLVCLVSSGEFSKAVLLWISKNSSVQIAIWQAQNTVTVHLVILKVSFVFCAIRPALHSESVWHEVTSSHRPNL